VYRLAPDGRLDMLLGNVPSPNGIVLSNDERFLFVAATRGNCVWRMPLLADGSVSKTGQFFMSYGPSGPDGLAMDEIGRLLVANPGLAYVWVLSPRAEPEEVLIGPAGASITNLAFGGADRKTLFCTDSTHGNIMRIEMTVAGTPLHQNK
jgi:gluconolactonase